MECCSVWGFTFLGDSTAIGKSRQYSSVEPVATVPVYSVWNYVMIDYVMRMRAYTDIAKIILFSEKKKPHLNADHFNSFSLLDFCPLHRYRYDFVRIDIGLLGNLIAL
jgi:hypothetical protein